MYTHYPSIDGVYPKIVSRTATTAREAAKHVDFLSYTFVGSHDITLKPDAIDGITHSNERTREYWHNFIGTVTDAALNGCIDDDSSDFRYIRGTDLLYIHRALPQGIWLSTESDTMKRTFFNDPESSSAVQPQILARREAGRLAMGLTQFHEHEIKPFMEKQVLYKPKLSDEHRRRNRSDFSRLHSFSTRRRPA